VLIIDTTITSRSSPWSPRSDAHAGPISTFSTFSTFSTSTTPTVARDFARSRDREIAIGENGEKKKKEATRNRARARGGGVPTARAPPEAPLRERSIVTRRRRRGASRVLVRTQTSERTTQNVSYELITRTRARVVVRIARERAGFTIGRRSRMRPPLGRRALRSRRRVRECTVGHRRRYVLFASSRRSGSRTDRPCASVRPASGAFCPMEGFSARTREGVVVFTF